MTLSGIEFGSPGSQVSTLNTAEFYFPLVWGVILTGNSEVNLWVIICN